MSAALVPVSGFQFPVSSESGLMPEQVSGFAFHVSRGGAARERDVELPQVVPASRLVDRPAPATVLTGIEPLDALTGGLPRGALTEICGPASSGRTSLLLALVASMTARGEVCALVDAGDCFDPKSAEAAGVDLRRLLWVRCRNRVIENRGPWSVGSGQKSQTTNRKSQMNSLEQALKATDLLLQGGGFGLVVVDLGDIPAPAARRVPLTSWFRFRRAVENTPTVLLVIEQEPYAKTCASVVMKLSAIRSQLSACSGRFRGFGFGNSAAPQTNPGTTHARILSGLEITAEMLRSAAQRKKPVQSAHPQWESRTAWAR